MRHSVEGDTIRPCDCVLLKAGGKKNDLPFVAKVAALWEDPEDGKFINLNLTTSRRAIVPQKY